MNHTPPSNYRVMKLVALMQEALDRLREEDGQIVETEEEIRSALRDEKLSVESLMASLGRAVLESELYEEMISQRMVNLKNRQDRAKRKTEHWRATLLNAMQGLGFSAYGDPEFSAAWRMGLPPIHITDVDALPEMCVETHKSPKKRVIRDLLAVGPVPGVVVGNAAPILTLRSK